MSDDNDDTTESNTDNDLLKPVEMLCCRLRRNVETEFAIPDDFGSEAITSNYEELLATSLPFLLAGSLMGNTSLKTLSIQLEEVLTELGARALVEGIRYSDIQSLNITTGADSDRVPTTEAIRFVIVESTKHVPKIECNFCLGDTHLRHLGTALHGNQKLHDLSICAIEEVTARGLALLLAGIRNSQIASLQLEVWDDVMDNFSAAFFLEGFMTLPTVRKIHLQGIWIDDLVSEHNPHKRFSFGGEETERVGTGMTLLQSFHLLEHLSIDHYFMNARDMTILAQGLGNLKSLDLDHNGIGDAEINAFVESWDNQSHLKNLVLCSNNVGLAGVCTLLRASLTHFSLTRLRLWSDDINIGFLGLAEISPLLAASRLLSFGIAIKREPVSDSKALKCQQEAAEAAGQALLRAAESNYTLQDITLPHIDIDEKRKKEIQVYLDLNKGGRRRLMEHGFAPTLWCHALTKFQNNASNIFYYLREFPGLVSWFPSSNDGNKRCYQGRSRNSSSKVGKKRKQNETKCD